VELPYYQVARFAGPNLIIGNTILVKHAELCPESAAAMQQIFLDAGFPAGGYVNIYASHDQIKQVIADPRVQGVSHIGSQRAGAAVAEIAGRHLKKVALELGGSDPFILLATDDLDADLEQALRVAEGIEAGMVYVNVVLADGVELPFGGIKRSGWGRELGRLGADGFVNEKMIRIG
jgi:acyl-CoA reductase-like NAD-dependent aldehyde dehydrogenase